MKNLFGNFELVPENEKGYVEELEKEFDISLPPVFKAFCQTFVLNSLKPDKDYRIFHPDEELGFYGFDFKIKELLDYFQEVGEPHSERKMLPIAISSIHSGGICVCLKSNSDIDKIFVNDEMSDDEFVEVSSDIFDFISQLDQFNFKS